jgi:hypothetical protein
MQIVDNSECHRNKYHAQRKYHRFTTALEHEAAREQIAFACMTDAVPARPVFDEPRAYIDDSRWYTICPEPQPGDFDFYLCIHPGSLKPYQ